MTSRAEESLIDRPEWFPVDFDTTTGEFLLLRLQADRIASAAFLDQRLGEDFQRATRLHWREIPVAAGSQRSSWIFHTAFCCSTLLSRALQSPPHIVALREPQALMRLATLALQPDTADIDGPLRAARHLLTRPWTADGSCLIKPTNQANNLLPRVLAHTRGKGILLYSSLEEFVVSCCKKLPAAETWVRWMAQHLLKDTALIATLGVEWNHPFHFVESAVLAWHAQIEWFARALSEDSDDRLRTLDMRALLDDPQAVVAACADWLELGIDAPMLHRQVELEFRRNAKHNDRPYDAAQRAQDRNRLRQQYSAVVDGALAWAGECVDPIAIKPTNWKPLVQL